MPLDTRLPTYSLIIATVDDDGDLAHCLASVAELPPQPSFEVIVVDQNKDASLDALLAEYSDRFPIVHERVAFRGASRARNHGASLAHGRWLGFPDDDCRLFGDTLAEVDRVAADPRVAVVTGRTVDELGRPNVIRWAEHETDVTCVNMFGCLTEATLFVDRDLFSRAGGFDERFGPGAPFPAAEGIDLMNRLFAVMNDRKARYSPAIRMRHPSKIPPWNRWAVGRFHAYAQGDGALIAKNPSGRMLHWGARTVVVAALQLVWFRGWKSLAYGARLAGLLRGFARFHLRREG